MESRVGRQVAEARVHVLESDLCVYIRSDAGQLKILTVWVDDLLMFASTDMLMKKMKNDVSSKWEVTDLGELSKIIRIKITHRERLLTISQEQYIKAILKRQGMQHANCHHH